MSSNKTYPPNVGLTIMQPNGDPYSMTQAGARNTIYTFESISNPIDTACIQLKVICTVMENL